MIFCGHCGLQLPPGSTRCPRCGASVEPVDVATTGGDLHIDDATIASRAFINQNQQPAQTSINQPLILRGNDYGTQDANGATSRVEQVNYNAQIPPTQQVRGNSYSGISGIPLQGTGNPPFQGNSPYPNNNGYPVQNTGGYPPQVPYPGYQPGMPYTDVPPQMGASYQHYPPQPTNTKGRTTGLILVFIGLLLILSAAILFAIQQGFIGSKKASAGNNGGTPSAITAIQQTQHITQHHYNYTQPSDTHLDFHVTYKQNTQQAVPSYIITQNGTMKFIVPSMQPQISGSIYRS
jgi:hypothetical protein